MVCGETHKCDPDELPQWVSLSLLSASAGRIVPSRFVLRLLALPELLTMHVSRAMLLSLPELMTLHVRRAMLLTLPEILTLSERSFAESIALSVPWMSLRVPKRSFALLERLTFPRRIMLETT